LNIRNGTSICTIDRKNYTCKERMGGALVNSKIEGKTGVLGDKVWVN
jgi:hypothetical protein